MAGNWHFELTTCQGTNFFYDRLDECFPIQNIEQSINLEVKKFDFEVEEMVKPVDAIEGDEVTFDCSVNDPFQQCTIWNTKADCTFISKKSTIPNVSNINNLDCDHKKNRELDSVGEGNLCVLTLKSVSIDDSGDWECEVYRNNRNPIISRKLSLNVTKFEVTSFALEPKPNQTKVLLMKVIQ